MTAIDQTRLRTCELGELTVDSAHLLRNHDGRSAVVGSSDSRHREAIPHAREVGGIRGELQLLLVDDIGVIEVTCRNDGVRTESIHRAEALGMLIVLHEPTRRLRTVHEEILAWRLGMRV